MCDLAAKRLQQLSPEKPTVALAKSQLSVQHALKVQQEAEVKLGKAKDKVQQHLAFVDRFIIALDEAQNAADEAAKAYTAA